MNKPQMGEFCWNELATTNTKSAKEFYGKLLGWEFTDNTMGDMTYTMIGMGDKKFGGIWQIPTDQKETTLPHWMSYITVDNIESKLEQAKKLGATIKVPVTAAGDMGSFAIIIDPTGAHIALWESHAS